MGFLPVISPLPDAAKIVGHKWSADLAVDLFGFLDECMLNRDM
jgi:hypothetical protein